MSTFVEYELADGTVVLVEAEAEEVGVREAALEGLVIQRAGMGFEAALAGVRSWVAALRRELEHVEADEVEVVFGLKAVGEDGDFAVGRLGIDSNYQVTLKWNRGRGEQPGSEGTRG